MIVVYTSPGCASCRKVKQWLKERDLKFVEKNIFSTVLNENEIKHLLTRSENGTEDIISKRSKIVQEQKIDFDDMTINELVRFIQQNPSILKRPIILNEKSFLVGYDEEEIGAFVPAELRRISKAACGPECGNYKVCGELREEGCVDKLPQPRLKTV
jgi:regulatory protein spx